VPHHGRQVRVLAVPGDENLKDRPHFGADPAFRELFDLGRDRGLRLLAQGVHRAGGGAGRFLLPRRRGVRLRRHLGTEVGDPAAVEAAEACRRLYLDLGAYHSRSSAKRLRDRSWYLSCENGSSWLSRSPPPEVRVRDWAST